MQGYKISANTYDLDFKFVYSFISQSYWAKDIPMDLLKKAMSNSLCFGVYLESGEQVGFARVITDKATFGYLADVFICGSQRGRGLCKWLIETILKHKDLQGLRRFMLATKDAHGLYSQFEFKNVENPEQLMQLWDPNIYTKS
jgi:N-acetylglutamate synthase-like GNAT family acetyltransferase